MFHEQQTPFTVGGVSAQEYFATIEKRLEKLEKITHALLSDASGNTSTEEDITQ